MLTALIYLGVSSFVLLLLSFLYRHEDKQGGRVILVSLRSGLDSLFVNSYRLVISTSKNLATGFLRLLLHYGAYRILKKAIDWIHNLENKLESVVRQNKVLSREQRQDRERNHLDEIADHKVESALTEQQRDELKQQL